MRWLMIFPLLAAMGCGQDTLVHSFNVRAGEEKSAEVTLTVADYDAIVAAIAAHKGKLVVVDLWSTACDPCVKEFPHLVALSKKYPSDKLACVSVCFDYIGIGKPEDVAPDVKEFLVEQGATFQNFLGSQDDATLSAKFDIPAIPIVFIFDREGKKAATFGLDGEFTYADVNAKVEALLKP